MPPASKRGVGECPTITAARYTLLLRDPHVHSTAKPFICFRFPLMPRASPVVNPHYIQYNLGLSN